MNRNVKLFVFVTLSVIGLVVYFSVASHKWVQNGPGPTSETSEKQKDRNESMPGQGNKPPGENESISEETIGLGFKKGDIIKYVMNFELETSIVPKNLNEPNGGKPGILIQIIYKGNLVLKIYAEDKNGWYAGFSVQNLKFISADKTNYNALTKEMEKGEILAIINKNGGIRKLIIPPEMSQEASNYLKNILAEWRVVLPVKDKGQKKWNTTEADTMGSYLATYTRLNSNLPTEIEKVKFHYLNTDTPNISARTVSIPQVVSSSIIITLNPYQTSINGTETVKNDTVLGIFHSTITYSFKLFGKESSSAIAGLSVLKKSLIDSVHSYPDWSVDNILGKGNRNDVNKERRNITQLADVLKNNAVSSQESMNAMSEMIDSVAEDASNIPPLIEALAQNKENAGMAAAITGVLGAANTVESQMALSNIFSDKSLPDKTRDMALQSLVQINNPLPELDGKLKNLWDENSPLKDTALLMLGVIGNKIMELDNERYNQIKNYLYGMGDKMSSFDTQDKGTLLSAVGNLGGDEVPNFIKEYMKTSDYNDDELIRQKVLKSLGGIYSSDASNTISKALEDGSSSIVRTTAAELLGEEQREGGCDVLMKNYVNESDETVKIAMLKSISNWDKSNPQAKLFIEGIANSNTSEDIKNFAKNLLDSNK